MATALEPNVNSYHNHHSTIRNKMAPAPPIRKVQEQVVDTDDTEFEKYAQSVERSIARERKSTQMRLKYINQLRRKSVSAELKSDEESVADIIMPSIEDVTDTEQSILSAAIIDGDTELLQNFLSDLEPGRCRDLLRARIAHRDGSSCLQLAIEGDDNETEIFKTLRLHMDKEMKKEVAMITDNFGDNALHCACQQGKLLFLQQLLANFTSKERLTILVSKNSAGLNCLIMAARLNREEIFNFLLKQLSSDPDMLRQAVFEETTTKIQKTVGHALVCAADEMSLDLLRTLAECMWNINSLKEFLFQNDRHSTLLHTLLSVPCDTEERELCIMAKCVLVMQLADLDEVTEELIWCCRKYTDYNTALSCLAGQPQTKGVLCNYFLKQVELNLPEDKSFLDYIIMKDQTFGENALHKAARTNNTIVLHALIQRIPTKLHMQYILMRNDSGSTPLHLAAYNPNTMGVFRRILKYFDLNQRHQLILDTDREGNTPILIAFITGNLDIVNCLLKEEWVPKRMIFPLMCARNNVGWTIIHLSCIRLAGDELLDSVLNFMSYLPGIKLSPLILHVDDNGNTALHLAALLYRPAVVKALLHHLKSHERRSYLLRRNKDGLVASQLCEMPDEIVVKYLEPLKNQDWSEDDLIYKRDYSKKQQAK